MSQESGNSGKGIIGIMNPDIRLEKNRRQKRADICAGIRISQVASGKSKCINNERGMVVRKGGGGRKKKKGG